MILLIGSTSFLGPAVLEKLLDNNYDVKCFLRPGGKISEIKKAAEKKQKKISFSYGDLQSIDSIYSSLKNIDNIIYLVDLKNTYFVNNFLKAVCRTEIKRVIFLSSTTVLLPTKSKDKELKIKSENLIKKTNLNYTILRPTMIYGCKNDKNFSKMIKFIQKKGFFVTFGNGNNLIQPIYINDVAISIANIITNKKTYGKIYDICGKEPLKYKEMLQIVKNKMNKPFKIIKFPLSFSKFLINIYSKISKKATLTSDQIERFNINKAYNYREAKKDFNFSPISFEEGIEKLIATLAS